MFQIHIAKAAGTHCTPSGRCYSFGPRFGVLKTNDEPIEFETYDEAEAEANRLRADCRSQIHTLYSVTEV